MYLWIRQADKRMEILFVMQLLYTSAGVYGNHSSLTFFLEVLEVKRYCKNVALVELKHLKLNEMESLLNWV